MNMRKFARLGEQRYGNDPRYNLQSVTEGYALHENDSDDDTELLKRICTAYNKAIEQQKLASKIYGASVWWEQIRRDNLAPVIRALETNNIAALQSIYRNFFRDISSSGLSIRPQNISKHFPGGKIADIRRRFILSDALYRMDYWKAQTDDRFTIGDLESPKIGNPFGVHINGTLVKTGSEYLHYYADKIRRLLNAKPGVVAEIGGGFGGMAYYLLRRSEQTTYLDFDVPESIAFASYYLIKAFPKLSFLLFGEGDPSRETILQFNIALMPLCELPKISPASIDLMFSSHALSEISDVARMEYLNQIVRTTRLHFWYIGDDTAGHSIQEFICNRLPSLNLLETHRSEWNKDRISQAQELELLYSITPPARPRLD
jgi:putative sugar O-methyltransferase